MSNTKAATAEQYDAFADTVGDDVYEEILFPKRGWKKDRIDNVLRHLKGKTLDVGTAAGTFAIRKNLKDPDSISIGLDFSEKILKKGNRIKKKYKGNRKLLFVNGDATKLPFRTGSFDTVVAADFVEHITAKQKEGLYREAFRVLKRHGRFVIYTPNRGGYILSTLRLKITAGLMGEGWGKYTIRFNKRAYDIMQYDHARYVKEYNNTYNATHFGVTFAHTEKRRLRRHGFRGAMIRFLPFDFEWARAFWKALCVIPLVNRMLSNNFLLIVEKP